MHDELATVLAALQALAAFTHTEISDPRPCPRCAATTVHRWGSFSGRQRYRCLGCRRTFSDFTGTPAAYSKRIGSWAAYCECMRGMLSLRKCAARVEIALSTAFRWRHAVLNYARSTDDTVLSGEIELDDIRLAYSEKGSRHLKRDPRQRGARGKDPFFFSTPRVNVISAWARCARGYSRLVDAQHYGSDDLRDVLLPRIRTPATIISRRGPMSSQAVLAKAAGACFRWVEREEMPADHTRNVGAFQRRLLSFLCPFRGVATKYLENYLKWHRLLDMAVALS